MNKQGGKRQGPGRKPLPISEKKEQIRIYIKSSDIERHGQKVLAAIAQKAVVDYVEMFKKEKSLYF